MTTWMWSLGDYALVASLLLPYAVKLAEACDMRGIEPSLLGPKAKPVGGHPERDLLGGQ